MSGNTLMNMDTNGNQHTGSPVRNSKGSGSTAYIVCWSGIILCLIIFAYSILALASPDTLVEHFDDSQFEFVQAPLIGIPWNNKADYNFTWFAVLVASAVLAIILFLVKNHQSKRNK